MLELKTKYWVVKDGKRIEQFKNRPTFAIMMFSQLLPNHVWSIETQEPTREEMQARLSQLNAEMSAMEDGGKC